MTEADDTGYPTDAELVAYLDGVLAGPDRARLARLIAENHELQRHLILLSGGNRPFREAFEPLLQQAPRDRLQAMLAGLAASQGAQTGDTRTQPRRLGIRTIAAGLLLFAGGISADRLLPDLGSHLLELASPGNESEPDDDWRQAVAEYLTLYTSETLVSIPDDANIRQRELAAVASKIGIALSPQAIALPNLSFKRAQLFEYDGKSLIQIAYLDPETGPMALCIFADGGDDPVQKAERRMEFNVIYWSRNGRGFMLIGRAPPERLRGLAGNLSGQIPG